MNENAAKAIAVLISEVFFVIVCLIIIIFFGIIIGFFGSPSDDSTKNAGLILVFGASIILSFLVTNQFYKNLKIWLMKK